jgi:hypothetical protein
MISFKESSYFELVENILETPIGVFYLLDGVIVGEIKEGVHGTWSLVEEIVQTVQQYYNSDGADLVYVSNRINTYSVDPIDWLNIYRTGRTLLGVAVVSQRATSWVNANLEALFIKSAFESFKTLNEAMDWAFDLRCLVLENYSKTISS